MQEILIVVLSNEVVDQFVVNVADVNWYSLLELLFPAMQPSSSLSCIQLLVEERDCNKFLTELPELSTEFL